MSVEAPIFLTLIKFNILILLLLVLSVSDRRRLCLTQDHKDLLSYFLLKCFVVSVHCWVYDPFWVNFCVWYEEGRPTLFCSSFLPLLARTLFPWSRTARSWLGGDRYAWGLATGNKAEGSQQQLSWQVPSSPLTQKTMLPDLKGIIRTCLKYQFDQEAFCNWLQKRLNRVFWILFVNMVFLKIMQKAETDCYLLKAQNLLFLVPLLSYLSP